MVNEPIKLMTRKEPRPMTRIEWYSMMYKPKKMKCNPDTAKELRKVFGNKIMNDIEIIKNKTKKEVKEKDGRQTTE